MSDLYLRYCAIALFKTAAERAYPLAAVFNSDSDEQKLKYCADVFRAVAESGARSTGEWLAGLLECDDNAFSRMAARGVRIPDGIKVQVEKELATFKMLSCVGPDSFGTKSDILPRFEFGGFSVTYEKLAAFYIANGCGALAHGDAFAYDDGGFKKIQSESVGLSDLKNYAEEKAEIVKNTENFINGLPAFHALLYGDSGTGKSSTVRAVASKFKGRLKTVELDSRRVELLPELLNRLAELKQKFIVFIDNLNLVERDGKSECLKAALEGSLVGASGNALIYCTSNRPGAVGEKTADRQVVGDRKSELELFDRFGLVVTYLSPNKDEFIDIFRQILSSRGIKWRDEYASIAELAALKKGGRTPRAAKQIADLIQTTYAEMR